MQAVLFDLDGTLWDRDQAFRALVESQYETFPELTTLPRQQYVGRVMELDDHGVGEKQGVYARVVGEFGLRPDFADVLFDHFVKTIFDYG